jgi:tRNA-uridine 2-sulfurtransferase
VILDFKFFMAKTLKENKNKKIIIAMSGGVDSSVAAKLLSLSNKNIMGIFLHFWKDEKAECKQGEVIENKCCSNEALADARSVCKQIGINLYTLNFANSFKKEVVDDFLDEYSQGRTPNPCIRCNKRVKLGLLIKKAQELGYDQVASGHYAILKRVKGKYKLFKSIDKDKDQTYFLYTLDQGQLSHLLFPLGEYEKKDVRKLAVKYKLPVAAKKDSNEICFINGKSHSEFLKRYLKLKSGDIKLMSGQKIGEHQGLPLYTVGQRRGIEIGGRGPYYAAKMDYKTNTLYVTDNGNDQALFRDSLIAKDVNWIFGEEPRMPLECEAVIRYRHKAVKCKVTRLNVKADKRLSAFSNQYEVKFNEPQRAITPGQSVVFYKGNELLGGGIIS